MASAFEAGGKKRIDNSFGHLGIRPAAGEAEDIRIVMLTGQVGCLFVPDQRGARARDFVRCDAHADSGSADQYPKLMLAFRNAPSHGLGVIRIVGGLCGVRAEVRYRDALFVKIVAQHFLELKAAMVGANGHAHPAGRSRAAGGHAGSLIDEFQHRGDALLDLVAAVEIHLVRPADRIADVRLVVVQGFVEFPQHESLFGRVRIEQGHGIDVAVSHPKNVIGLLDQLSREHPAALLGNIDAQFPQGLHGMLARRLALDGPYPCRKHPEIVAALDRVTEQPLCHGTPANVSRANEQNRLHSLINESNLRGSGAKVNGEIRLLENAEPRTSL